jgi:hypothetical protein
MRLDQEFVKQTVQSLFRRSEAARNAGGIPMFDVVNGKSVPEGWERDSCTLYYLPPNVILR